MSQKLYVEYSGQMGIPKRKHHFTPFLFWSLKVLTLPMRTSFQTEGTSPFHHGIIAMQPRLTINYFRRFIVFPVFVLLRLYLGSWREETRGESSKTDPWANFREKSSLIKWVQAAKVVFLRLTTEAHSFHWSPHSSGTLLGVLATTNLQLSVMSDI